MDKWIFKACPFCGSVDIGIKHKSMGFIAGDGPCVARRQIWAFCKYCNAEGPKKIADIIGSEEEEAVALETWNRRFDHVCNTTER